MTEPLPERFERARAAFFAGLAAFEAGRLDAAERHYRDSLAALPGRASTLINLAAAQLELGRPDEALASAEQALQTEPDALDAWLHQGSALLRLGRHAEALVAFERLGALDPTLAAAPLLQAQALERLGRPEAALAAFDAALVLAPASIDAWSGRGGLLRELGRIDEAAAAFRAAIRHGADPTLHAYYLAAVGGDDPAPAAAPPGYVTALFDDYADDFDTHLVEQLGYRGPQELLGRLVPPPDGRFREVLDLGCGTGLCAPLLRPLAERLTGVDLAPRMVEKARERGLYDRLEADEIVRFLTLDTERRDLVVAADVLAYLGDLGPLFAAVRRRLDPGGLFCFTLEALAPGRGDYALLPSLRYAHAEAYLRRLAGVHAFAFAALERRPVREDQRTPIDGLFVHLRAAPAAG